MPNFQSWRGTIAPALAVLFMASVLLLQPVSAESSQVDDTGTGWDLTNLNLDVTLLPASGELLAQGTLRVRLTGAAASTGPDFELNRNGFEFVSISSSLQAKEARVRGRLARVRLAQPVSRGQEIEVTVNYKYKDPGGITLKPDGAHAAGTDLWYPSPSNREGELNDVDAAGTVRYKLPRGWQMLSVGTQSQSSQSGDFVMQTWTVDTDVAHGFIAGPFALHVKPFKENKVRIMLAKPDASRAARIANTFSIVTAQLARWFGPFPYKDFGIAEVPSGLLPFSGRSLPGLFIADETNFDQSDIDHLILAHETAHAWWGNFVKVIDPGNQLLVEGLAHYSVCLVIEWLEGKAAAVEWLRFGRVTHPRRFRAFYQGLTPT